MPIGITGGSGQLARLTADKLLEQIDPSELVLVTRNPDKVQQYADRGVSVRRGGFDEPAGLPQAFAGIDRLLIISTDDFTNRIAQHRAAVEAATQADVGHLLYTSIPNPTDANVAIAVESHRATEEAIFASGRDWTILRNSIYADYQVPTLTGAIESGQLVLNNGDGACAYVTREDCAAVAAVALSGDGHAGKLYDVTGPELLTMADLAAIASEVSGVQVEAIAVDDEAFAAGLAEHAGLPSEAAAGYATFGRAIREGQLAALSTVVRDLTGHEPQSLRELFAAAFAGSGV
jgi:NAD(P)H dehydrogenase (quinone)